tara:strand:- start:4125 stop:4877 length:753 start_codon:yes stop_codon:yes gene_type:complete
MKKGQITVFIVLGLVIVVILSFIFYLREDVSKFFIDEQEESIVLPSEVIKVRNFVESCIEEVSLDALESIGKYGGYVFPTKISIESGIPYYAFNNKNYIPEKEIIEGEISFYINQQLDFCTRNFVDFPQFNIKKSAIRSFTNIDDNDISIDLNYLLEIYKGDEKFQLNRFQGIKIPIRLGIIYGVVNEILKDQNNYNPNICVSCIADIAEENDLFIEIENYGSNIIVFNIIDKKLKLKNEEYKFSFATKI